MARALALLEANGADPDCARAAALPKGRCVSLRSGTADRHRRSRKARAQRPCGLLARNLPHRQAAAPRRRAAAIAARNPPIAQALFSPTVPDWVQVMSIVRRGARSTPRPGGCGGAWRAADLSADNELVAGSFSNGLLPSCLGRLQLPGRDASAGSEAAQQGAQGALGERQRQSEREAIAKEKLATAQEQAERATFQHEVKRRNAAEAGGELASDARPQQLSRRPSSGRCDRRAGRAG